MLSFSVLCNWLDRVSASTRATCDRYGAVLRVPPAAVGHPCDANGAIPSSPDQNPVVGLNFARAGAAHA